MKIKLKKSGPWLFCKNEHAASYSKYKLHAFLPITHFDTHQKEIYDLLYKAVEDGIIPEFKILNIGGSDELTQEIGDVNTNIEQNPNARLLNSPFTIYLYEDNDPQLIIELCRQIEDKLRQVPITNRQLLSIADLPLTDHVTFRQETLDGEYVKIAGTHPEQLGRLKEEAELSTEYRSLIEKVNSLENEPSNELDPDKEKEDYVRGFYNSHFKYYERQTNSENIHDQFQGACILLGLNPEELLKLTEKEDWDKLINHAYRLSTRKFHPDTIKNNRFSDTIEKANKIFNLAKNAQSILNKIAEDPKLIDKKKILEQEKYLPQYQYELIDGFNSDPYFYIHMASDASRYILIKNWDFQIVPETLGEKNNENSQTGVVLYKPKLKIYKGDERKTIDLPGYQAFYYLLVAGALPRRFDGGHFHMIFGYGKSKLSTNWETWLMAQGLTTPEFFLYFENDYHIACAIEATKQGIVTIGRNEHEVFIYYYQNHPDTVRFIPNDDNEVMKEKLVQYILDHPDNLSKLEGHILIGLAQLDFRIKNFIFGNKVLTLKLSFEFKENEVLVPCFKNIESQIKSAPLLNKLSRETIEYMLKGQMDFIPLLSNKKLYELKELIDMGLPSWMTEIIDEELLIRSGKIEVVDYIKKQKNAYYWDITPTLYVKKAFLNGDNSIIEGLNKETLIWLAAQPEVHWSSYLPICHALLKLNERNTAYNYLLEMAKGLDIEAHFEDLDQFISKLSSERLDVINQEWRKKRVEHLQEQYNQVINTESETLEPPSDIVRQLRNLGVDASSMSTSYRDSLQEQFFELLDRLKAGEKSEELLKIFNKLKGKVNAAGFDWQGISEKDKQRQWVIGGQVFNLMKAIIAVKDNNANLLGSREELKERFGINPHEKDMVRALKQLYFLYECLSTPQEFYRHLNLHLGRNDDDISDISKLDVDFIKECLLNFADNEFAVIIDGQRETAHYKSHRFIDFQNIRDFKDIHNLYLRLGEEKHFNDLLTNAFQRLLEAHKKNEELGQNQPSAPLLTYTKMRQQIDTICPQFENLLIQNSIYRIIKNEYRLLNRKVFNFSNNRAIALRDNIASVHSEPDFLIDEGLSTKTHRMLIELRNFLSSYSDTPLYNNLLDQVISDSILKHYLKAIGIDVTEQDKKKLSKAISTLPDAQFEFPDVNILMLENCSHSREKEDRRQRKTENHEDSSNAGENIISPSSPTSFLESKAHQMNRESMRDIEILREKIKKAIIGVNDRSDLTNQATNSADDCYLEWMKINAQGARGLTRFSHWYHGDTGVRRAKELLETVNDSTSTYEDIVNKLDFCLSQSSNTRHSLKSYLRKEFGEDNLKNILESHEVNNHGSKL